MTLTNDNLDRLDVADGGLVRHVLNATPVMQRATRADEVLTILTSTVRLLAPAVAVWAGRRELSSGDVADAISVDPDCPAAGVPSTSKLLEHWSRRLGAGYPPFEVDIRATPLAEAVGHGPELQVAVVFPMSTSAGCGALALIGPFGELTESCRSLVAVLCEHASMAMDLAVARASAGRVDALFGTLTQLAASHSDPDLVLGTIVRSAARLLGTDAAHVMLVDEEKSVLTVKTAFGITSRRFYEATCRTDELLPGAAIRTRRVVCVRDMSEHDQARHYRSEGVRSVMCAPMFVEDELVGVLFVAHREIHDPSAEDRALLAALASAAAVSIVNARLHAERERSLEQLSEINRLLGERSDALERTLRFQRQTTSLVLEGRGLLEISRVTAEATGGTMVILDRELEPLHPLSRPLGELGIDLDVVSAAIAECRQGSAPGVGLVPIQRTDLNRSGALMAPVELGPDHSAYVVLVEGERPFDETDFGILEAAVTAIGLELMRDRASAEAEARVTGGLFQSLLSDEGVDDATVLRRASYLGFELGGSNLVIAVAPEHVNAAHPDRFEAMIRRAFRRLPTPAAIFERDATVYVVLPDSAGITAKKIKEQCALISQEVAISGRNEPVRIAHAGPHRGVAGVRRAVRESGYALHVQGIMGRTGVGVGFDDLGIWSLLGRVADREQLAEFANSVLGTLIAYDAARGADLIHTLQELAKCNYHYRSAAEALYAHPNTLRYRVNRITEMANLDLSDAEDRLRIELALRILDVLGVPQAAPTPVSAGA